MKKNNKPSEDFDYKSKEIEIIAKKLEKMFEKNPSGFPTTYPPDEGVDIEKLDNWCEKMLKGNQQVKYIKGKRYPYSNYTHVDNLLKKYGVGVIDELKKLCPLKRVSKTDLCDSFAFAIYRLKVDPTSFLDIPSFESTWVRISDKS